jgi:hypothetical protein
MEKPIIYMFTAKVKKQNSSSLVFYDIINKDIHTYMDGEHYINGLSVSIRDSNDFFSKYVMDLEFDDNVIEFENENIYFNTRKELIDNMLLERIVNNI